MAVLLRMTELAACLGIATAGITSATASAAETVYFLVAERPETVVHDDSYVLPLSDPAAIAQARALMEAEPGTLPSIAIARVEAGADGINRDHLAPGAPAWSWHITGFEGFTDFAIEILDGWPTFVEQDVEGWIANTGGRIGFWNYTVTAELPTLNADFDEDGDVDGDDLARWKADFGVNGAARRLQGDADADLDVDGADLLTWQRQLGSAALAVSSNAPVPEPTTSMLVILAAVAIRRSGGRMRQELVSA